MIALLLTGCARPRGNGCGRPAISEPVCCRNRIRRRTHRATQRNRHGKGLTYLPSRRKYTNKITKIPGLRRLQGYSSTKCG
jgi:hypothetical protein